MDIRNVVIDAEKTVGKNPVLVDVAPSYEYKDGKRSDAISGFKYTIAMPAMAYDKLAVKIEGALQMDKPEGDYPVVAFDTLELYTYWTPQGYQVAARAKGIHAINAKPKQ